MHAFAPSWRSAAEGGSATLELVIAFPAVLILVFALIQAALCFHARNLALAAAQEGVRAARAEPTTLPDGISRARAFLHTAGGDSLLATSVNAGGSTATQVRITVTGRALSVLPGVPGLTVSQTATGPKERFTTAGTP